MRRLLPITAALVLLTAGAASAAKSWPDAFRPVGANPADRLGRLPLDAVEYDHARRCTPRAGRPGTQRLVKWLARNHAGSSWGTYRCEKWGRGSASLHAEKRAIDWHLDARRPAERRAGRRLIAQLLAPDAAGRPHALARRMGVQELIWDCRYWGAGMDAPRLYSPCATRKGRLRKRVDPTIAHRDHVHIGLSKLGAAARTSFWTRKQPARPEPEIEPEPESEPPYEDPREEPLR